MRTVYAIVLVIGFTAIVAQHLTSPSSGRALVLPFVSGYSTTRLVHTLRQPAGDA